MQVLRGSLAVVRQVPSLLVPGLVHACSVLAVGALLIATAEPGRRTGTSVALLLAGLLVVTCVGTLCAAVVVAVTTERMAGRQAGLRDGVARATTHLPALLAWSLLSATVGAALRLLEERLGPVGRWLASGAGVLFAVGTLLVVPVLVVEGRAPLPALRRSVRLFRARWGEAAVGDVGLGLVLLLAFLPAFAVACALLATSTTAGAAALVVLLAAHLSTASTATAVLSAALHRVAVHGDAGPFGDLSALFQVPAARYTPSYAAPHGQWDAS